MSDDERKYVTTRATTPDNVATSDNKLQRVETSFFFKNGKVISYYTRCGLLQTVVVVVVVDVFKIYIILSTRCHL